ncbi:TIGR01244 family phosphatase [Altererythrobacter aurantiacus]|uniref:TIGR01244 family phosphatase n=1 Tax=Parapontixanthobacter aurantiacus TaxID=1463599 RepID=A0A844ZG81_9SPHN|nr:TIGR01244 family sulfur transferase [Parapontixanthobacter aurantiacus]MXO86156.1 TIGR01244 family phosphatase [Parapontixanthobacter aurantiacus]
MTSFRRLTDDVLVSPQIEPDDLAEARDRGVTLIVNNRPDGESPDQVPGDEIAAKASELGLNYVAIPIGHAGFSANDIDAMRVALDQADGTVLAYCRSGTRSTLLWALAEAANGRDVEEIAAAARQAGYDVGPIRSTLEALHERASR